MSIDAYCAAGHELATIYASPGANALVISSGSGSDVIGCLRAKLNMVAIDKDHSQFSGCKARLVDLKANMDVEHKVGALEVAQVQQLKKVARRFASWLPDQLEEVELEEVEAVARSPGVCCAGRGRVNQDSHVHHLQFVELASVVTLMWWDAVLNLALLMRSTSRVR